MQTIPLGAGQLYESTKVQGMPTMRKMKNASRRAENRALRSIKDRKVRAQPYTQIPVAPAVQTAPNPAYNSLRYPPPPFRSSAERREPCMCDVCYICKQHGHWKANCPLNNFKTSTNSSNQQTSSAAKQ